MIAIHGYDLCREAVSAHDGACCERCHAVGLCGFGVGVVLGVVLSAEPHDYPHPEAVMYSLALPADARLTCEAAKC